MALVIATLLGTPALAAADHDGQPPEGSVHVQDLCVHVRPERTPPIDVYDCPEESN